jgi:hypothetical protein
LDQRNQIDIEKITETFSKNDFVNEELESENEDSESSGHRKPTKRMSHKSSSAPF